jgi:F0F1-type ATP synthase membrane subunit b/b'
MFKKICVATIALGLMTAMMMPVTVQAKERHPKIRQAIRALENAKKDMQQAAHDFGGHRAEALAACDKAIEQLNLALNYDKK